MKIIKKRKSFTEFLIENQNKELYFKIKNFNEKELQFLNEINKINDKVFHFFYPSIPLQDNFKLEWRIKNSAKLKTREGFSILTANWVRDSEVVDEPKMVNYKELIEKYNFDENN